MRIFRTLLVLAFLYPVMPSLHAQEIVQGKIEVRIHDQDSSQFYMQDKRIYATGLDTTTQVRFWRVIIKMTPDSGIMNLASNRMMLSKMSVKAYMHMTEAQRDSMRNALRATYLIADKEPILFSAGRNDFYNVPGVMANITKGIRIFETENTDPFYAQAILLIESPGKSTVRSYCGAMGPFQLMRAVARNMGLKVYKGVDERKDFDKSAWAAAKLIRTICIPYTNKMLEDHGIAYNESDLWYRLLVLHVYHAGAGNVAMALNVINPSSGSVELIKQLWQTKAGNFGMASQNYSQVALANLIELDNVIASRSNDVHFVPSPDKSSGSIETVPLNSGN
jgi:hypothetical protein